MADEAALDGLLSRWEEAFDRGEVLTAEVLAHDRPDLVAELSRRIETLRDCRPLEPTAFGGGRGTPARDPSGPRVIKGRYRLLRPIASGGEGHVWQAHDEVLGRDVALKLPQFDGTRLIDEARKIAKLKSHHILTVHDTGFDADGTAFIATELMPGGTLADRIRELGGSVPTAQALTWTGQIAAALQVLQDAGLTHRDVKPINILLAGDGSAVLADFGLVIDVASQATGTTGGTAPYMAPEQVAGQKPGFRSDVYSLALVVHEMLAGALPAAGPIDATAAARAIAVGSGRPVSPRIPEPLRPVIEKALSARPAERHESPAVFARELAQAWQPSPETSRDRRVPTWATIAVAVVLVAGVAVGSWIRTEQRRARAIGDRQIEEAQQAARKAMSIAADAQRKVGEIRPPVVAPPSLQQLLAIARTNMLHEQYAVAEAEYTQALDRDPGNLEALGNRGLCRLNLERLDAAVEDFDAFLAARPDDTTALRRRASAHGQLRDFPRAIADLERAMALTPNDTDLRERLAKTREAMNRRDEAEQDR